MGNGQLARAQLTVARAHTRVWGWFVTGEGSCVKTPCLLAATFLYPPSPRPITIFPIPTGLDDPPAPRTLPPIHRRLVPDHVGRHERFHAQLHACAPGNRS